MSKSLAVVVAGSSAGLGRAIANGFAKRGASTGLIALNLEALHAAKEECEALGGQALVLPLDVADSDAVDAAASKVEEVFGPIDIWVNDAMVSVFSPVKETEASDYKGVTDVLYLGFVHDTLVTLALILTAKRSPLVRKLLGAKLTMDAAAGGFNAGRQVVSFGKLCSWCTGTAIAAGFMAYAGRSVIRDTWSSVDAISEAAIADYEKKTWTTHG